jgi:hypothetical protein
MSFGSDEGFQSWLAEQGQSLPGGAPTAPVLRRKGSDYINATYGSKFSGVPTDGIAQIDSWPRAGAKAYGQTIPDDVIPVAVEQASYAAAFHEAENPGSLSVAASHAGALKRKKVDVIEREYFEGTGDAVADATVRLSSVEGLLAPFLRPESTSACLGLWSVG